MKNGVHAKIWLNSSFALSACPSIICDGSLSLLGLRLSLCYLSDPHPFDLLLRLPVPPNRAPAGDMGEHDLSEQIVLKRGGGSLVRSYLKALPEGGSDQKRFQVTGCGASDASVVAIHTAMLFRILIKMSLADYTAS